ncbi:MAG: NifB/NifX family molybdenum-iron cluster-binding protein [Desulfobulbaceae bacterium]
MNRLYVILAMMLFGILGMAPSLMAGDGPVYAVAAESESPDAQVSAQAARCPWFLLFDARGNLVEAVANPHQRAAGGAGPQAADFLAGKGIQTVIAGEFGRKMADALKSKGMTYRTSSGTAADEVRTVIEQ